MLTGIQIIKRQQSVKFGIVTLFPEIIDALNYGITGRAFKDKLIEINCWNPRDFTSDKHRTVDDRPYGGGPGMLMKVEPLVKAIDAAKKTILGKVIYLSPQGRSFTQAAARDMAKRDAIILVAGRYEGIDERVIETHIDEEWSIGDYVLSGGELAACVMIDTLTRLLPGALGHEDSAKQDSFMEHGLLDYPHYTRPEEFDGMKVPEVLLTGDHKTIEKWRLKQALGKTWLKRPDLLKKLTLNDQQTTLLHEFMSEEEKS